MQKGKIILKYEKELMTEERIVMAEPKFKRVLLKISGEALAGSMGRGLDFDVIGQVCDVVKRCTELGVQVGIVVGGGNFWRGLNGAHPG